MSANLQSVGFPKPACTLAVVCYGNDSPAHHRAHCSDPVSRQRGLIAAVGGLWALAFYLHQRHAEDARFLKDLWGDFNARYDKMNNALQSARGSDGELDGETRLRFIDYFNLCVEEWVFKELGYIPLPIWEAWHNGMHQYGSDPRVAELWHRECETDSYYGFNFPTSIKPA